MHIAPVLSALTNQDDRRSINARSVALEALKNAKDSDGISMEWMLDQLRSPSEGS
ncbi:MAG: hypothetical protein ABJL99_00805 [Aliishimia sp.]